MRDGSQLAELEAEYVNRLIQAYPAGLGYTLDRDPRDHMTDLVAEGRVERKEIHEGVFYRLTDEHAEEIRRVAAAKAEGAEWN